MSNAATEARPPRRNDGTPAPVASVPRSADQERGGVSSVRRMLLVLVLIGTAGLAIELLLLEHYESVWQWVPLALLATGLVAGLALGMHPSPWTVRLFQATMVLFVVAAVVGLYLHFRGNAEWEREMDASVRGVALLWKSLRGATPALAPGAMAQLGLLGLILSYRHPALS